MNNGTYLGDGVYIYWDGNGFVLYTWNGYERTNQIYLELDTYMGLVKCVDEMIRSGEI